MPDYTLTQPAATVDSTLVKSATYIPKAMVTVADITARNAIATADKSNGKVVKVLDDGSGNVAYYSWNSGGSTWDNAYFPVEDGTITSSSLDTDLYNEVFVPTYSTEAEVTQEITSLASTVLTGKLTAEVQGNTVVNILPDAVAGCESTTGWTDSGVTTTTDASNEIEGTNCLKMTLSGAGGQTQRDILSLLDTTRYYMISAFMKNYNATDGIKLRVTCTGDAGNIDSSYVSVTSYTRVAVLLQPSDFNGASSVLLAPRVVGSAGQYGYVDALMLQEITSTEYALGATALLTKYAYHRGTKSTDRIAVKSVGVNHIRNGNGEEGLSWWNLYNTPQNLSFSDGYFTWSENYAGDAEGIWQRFRVKPNTQYRLRCVGRVTSGNIAIYKRENVENSASGSFTFSGTSIIATNDTATYVTFTTGSNTNYFDLYFIYDGSGTAYLKEVSIYEGTTATSYTPYTETTAILPNELKRISSSIYDVWDANLGKHTKNISDWVTLSGNAFTWNVDSDQVGYKLVYITSAFSSAVASIDPLIIKYNGKALIRNVSITSAPDVADMDANKLVEISVADTDTGFDESWVSGTSFTGMTWGGLIKAYMNGWKLTTANTNVASCVWTGIASGTVKNAGAADYSHVTTTIDTGFTPYKMIYQYATPVVTNYYPNILTAEPFGTIYVSPFASDYDFYDSGCVISNTSYPMSSLEYVNIVDKGTGALTPVALSTCTVAVDGLSFTSTAISAEDLVDFGYNHKYLSTVPTLSYICDENLKATVVSNREDIEELDRKIEQVITQERIRVRTSTATIGSVSATTTYGLFIAPIACEIADVKFMSGTSVSTNNTDYWTMEVINKGSAGSDTNVICSSNTTVTSGSAITAYDARDLGTINATYGKLAQGDVVLVKFTKSGSATTITEGMVMLSYLAGN